MVHKLKIIKNKDKDKESLLDINELNLINQCLVSLNNQNIMFIQKPIQILVINNAIPSIHYKELSNQYPSLKQTLVLDINQNKMLSSNHRSQFNINYDNLKLKHQYLSPLWNKFFEFHLNNNFIQSISKIFNNTKNINNLEIEIDFKVGYKLPIFYSNYQSKKIQIDKNILFIGWFFMRKDEDDSTGGNLEIYNNSSKITNIPYQNNCLVILENQNQNQNCNVNGCGEGNGVYYNFSQRQMTLHSQRYISFTISKGKHC
jgi:hypothetical protein